MGYFIVFHLIFLDHRWPLVVEIVEGKTEYEKELLHYNTVFIEAWYVEV
jgi:hypothetical protein